MQKIIFHKADLPGPHLGRGPLWFDSYKRPLSLCILCGRLREVRLYYALYVLTPLAVVTLQTLTKFIKNLPR